VNKPTAPPSRFATLALRDASAPAGLTVDLAHSRLDRQRALELHRDVYARKGLLRGPALTPHVLPQACAPGSAIFVAKAHDRIVGTITFYMDSAIGLPMDDVHGDEVAEVRGRFTRVAEVGGLAVLEDRRGVGITMRLYHATFRWALATSAQCIVACVNPSSRRVYSKLLLFDVLGACKQHPRFLGAPSIPIGIDLTTAPAREEDLRGGAPDRDLRPFFFDPHPPYAFTALASAQYLQWSDDEVSDMIRTQQLILVGDDHVYVERHYATNGVARGAR
jgi:GNAT superfamily N-acetyltransferase